MRYGHFDDARREYVIHRPDTPLPWINYLGAEDFVGIISNTAGGYAFYRDARLRRLTRYRYNNVPPDSNGRYLYVRDEADGVYWSPTWQPTQTKLDRFSCRHGLGYTVIGSTFREIDVETTYFVPVGGTLEIWSTRIENHRREPVRLSLFSAIEFCLWNALDDATNFQRNLNIGEVGVEGSVILHKTEYRERRDHFAYFACSEPVAGFETQRDAFLGPYRGWDRPVAVERGTVSNSLGVGGSPIGVHHVRLRLEPGEARRVIFLLGYHENHGGKFVDAARQTTNVEGARRVIGRYVNPVSVDEAFAELQRRWRDTLESLQVTTSDPTVDRMINTWNAYQGVVAFNVARSASGYESGIGRGIGFRDANQDLLGCVHMIPQRARARLVDLASTQLVSGGAYHQYQPLTRRGNNEIGSGFNDDPLWLILAAAAYLKETGDWSLLDEEVGFQGDSPPHSLFYDHLVRAAQYTLDRLGPHGLPLIGRADWNDCLNLNSQALDPDEPFQTAPVQEGSVATSVFIAGLFCLACEDLVEIARRRRDEATEKRFESAARAMRAAVEEHGWDGGWFLRAYDARGARVGSHLNREGQIYIEPQGVCPMAGIGLENGMARAALDAVRDRLATEHGILLLQPAYTSYDPDLGEISSYPPGYKENASVFCHANPWVIIAECRLGRGDRAWDYALRINPARREEKSEVHQCEPYVYAQMIAGRDARDHGRARNSWLTGTASWSYVAMTQWILGVRPTFDGLQVDPCIPSALRQYRVVRKFRGATYDIRVENPDGVMRGVCEVRVDGKAIAGSILPTFGDHTTHSVHVTLGSGSR
jgi:cellobiose phosphorylase